MVSLNLGNFKAMLDCIDENNVENWNIGKKIKKEGDKMNGIPKSKLTKRQKKTLTKKTPEGGHINVEIRYDDECSNGHNTFGITMMEYSHPTRETDKLLIGGGADHNRIAELFPELEKYIKWHLTSSDEPMHYIANTTYHAENGDLEYARRSAVAPDATLEQLKDEQWLNDRLPDLMEQFKKDMEELGFEY